MGLRRKYLQVFQRFLNELADIILQLEQSLTIRIYDDLNEVIGAIRLVHVDEIQQIDQLRAYQHTHKAYLH